MRDRLRWVLFASDMVMPDVALSVLELACFPLLWVFPHLNWFIIRDEVLIHSPVDDKEVGQVDEWLRRSGPVLPLLLIWVQILVGEVDSGVRCVGDITGTI